MMEFGIATLMMLPLIAGGVCFVLSAKVTEDIGKE
jgi:hypothetical protein